MFSPEPVELNLARNKCCRFSSSEKFPNVVFPNLWLLGRHTFRYRTSEQYRCDDNRSPTLWELPKTGFKGTLVLKSNLVSIWGTFAPDESPEPNCRHLCPGSKNQVDHFFSWIFQKMVSKKLLVNICTNYIMFANISWSSPLSTVELLFLKQYTAVTQAGNIQVFRFDSNFLSRRKFEAFFPEFIAVQVLVNLEFWKVTSNAHFLAMWHFELDLSVLHGGVVLTWPTGHGICISCRMWCIVWATSRRNQPTAIETKHWSKSQFGTWESEKMNIFRLCGDMSHLFAMLILLAKVWKTRSVSGVSAKSQVGISPL